MNLSEVNVTEYVDALGWRENPFTFRIYPDLMVGYEKESQDLLYTVQSHNKISLVVGETGAGKTTLLRWLEQQTGMPTCFMSKPPRDPDRFLTHLSRELSPPSLFSRFFGDNDPYDVPERLQRKLSEPTLLLVDEGQETTVEVLEWVRTLTDTVDNLIVVLSGLPGFADTVQREVHTLHSRTTTLLQLESLNRDETLELIRRRIEHVGGTHFEPFTQDALLHIYERSNGFPREVLRICNVLLLDAARNRRHIIDVEAVKQNPRLQEISAQPAAKDAPRTGEPGKEENGREATPQPASTILLTEKQEEIVDALLDAETATAAELVEVLDTSSYKSRDHAVRSINNILNRLRKDGILTRTRRGRAYTYRVEDRVTEELTAQG